ncbi:hypothetical protein L210DRAFT_3632092 [Boletus edulis BED1]|uniref:Uncharacterized protein n=1 Tax=Boletus edulis BED1 TaxID=1328754 RepID=A0AAD4BPZ5_BOLED|nr:hypothetical protein L210DRAFT_3632092 [Boletus edulis BED1]
MVSPCYVVIARSRKQSEYRAAPRTVVYGASKFPSSSLSYCLSSNSFTMNALVPFLANAFGGSDRLKPFSFVMGHLTVNREVWLIHETLNISSAQILLAMKLTMFKWNVYDGQKLKKDLDQWQFQKRITKYPTLLEFLGYTTIGLTWGGTTYTWGSVNVLIPLVLGLVGLGTFIAYEVTLTKYPLVPFSLMTNVTSVSG